MADLRPDERLSESGEALTKRLAEVLRSSVNKDGGWGYFPGKASRLEPTCWAALALLDGGASESDSALVKVARSRVVAWQRTDGLLSDVDGAPPNVAFSGLAAIVLQHALAMHRIIERGQEQAVARLLTAITRTAGSRQERNKDLRQDNQLVGWPWNEGTFSWVEPTSWCLIALKKAAGHPRRKDAAARIVEAERVLADRCCLAGGWNAGNPNAMGKELLPYVPNTALGLLALQDRPALPEVVRSVAWLAINWQRERSALALSLAEMAMTLHGRTIDDLERALWTHAAAAGPPANTSSTAILLYALTGLRHGYAALKM